MDLPAPSEQPAAYTAVDWVRTASGALLAAGTRDGRLCVWQVDRASVSLAGCEPLRARIQRIAWASAEGPVRIAAATSQGVAVLVWDTALRREALWATKASVSMLAWDGPTLHIALPRTLCAWDLEHDKRSEVAVASAYATGTVSRADENSAADTEHGATACALEHGALVAWDGEPRASPWETSAQPWWGVASMGDLVAALYECDEDAPWRYRVARRLTCALWTPWAQHWDATPAALARLAAWKRAPHPVPIVAWRAILLACRQCADPRAAWQCVAARITEEYSALLDDAQRRARTSTAYADWASCLPAAQSLAWAAAYVQRQTQPDAALAPVPHLRDAVVAMACAAAAHDAQDHTPYTRRLAARCLVLATAHDTHAALAECLTNCAHQLTPASAQWDLAEPLSLEESCGACHAAVFFQWEQYTSCANGHPIGTCIH